MMFPEPHKQAVMTKRRRTWLTPLQIAEEWESGCSCVEGYPSNPGHPGTCAECTDAMVSAMIEAGTNEWKRGTIHGAVIATIVWLVTLFAISAVGAP